MRRDATLTMSEVKLSQFRTIIGRMLVTVQRGSFFWSIDSNSSSIFTYDEENFEPRFLVQFDKEYFDNFECSFNVIFTVNDLKQFFGVISSCVSGKATSLELYIDLETEAEEGSIFQLRAKFQFEDFTSTHFIPLTQKECPVDPKRITEKITHSKSQLLQSTLTALESLEIVTKNYSFISLTEDTMKVKKDSPVSGQEIIIPVSTLRKYDFPTIKWTVGQSKGLVVPAKFLHDFIFAGSRCSIIEVSLYTSLRSTADNTLGLYFIGKGFDKTMVSWSEGALWTDDAQSALKTEASKKTARTRNSDTIGGLEQFTIKVFDDAFIGKREPLS